MKRRAFLDTMSSGIVLGISGCTVSDLSWFQTELGVLNEKLPDEFGQTAQEAHQAEAPKSPLSASSSTDPSPQQHEDPASSPDAKKRIYKSQHFDETFDDDIFVKKDQIQLLKNVTFKLSQIKAHMGYAHFNLVSFDEAIRFADHYNKIKPFTREELAFVEQIFYENAKSYGFYGEKVTPGLTDSIRKRDTIKIPGTGHYIYQGESLKLYERICRELGPTIILTSGIRSNVKQMHLFLAKAVAVGGNLSRASRSLAPPGHSFHGIGDFDVGKRGLGYKNFTNYFSTTKEYDQLIKMGFIRIRYVKGNDLGVRFEPWHIKVVG